MKKLKHFINRQKQRKDCIFHDGMIENNLILDDLIEYIPLDAQKWKKEMIKNWVMSTPSGERRVFLEIGPIKEKSAIEKLFASIKKIKNKHEVRSKG